VSPRRTILVVGTLLASLCLGALSCNKVEGSGGGGAAGSASGGARGKGLTYAVDALSVESTQVDYIVLASGTLDAFEHVQVTSRVAGVVDKVSFTEGQEVKKGDLLVVIESERFALAVNSAKALLDKAKAAESDAEAQLARRDAATKDHPGLVTGEEVATYRTKVLTAKADTATANEALKVASVNLRDAYVRAPMTGVMQTRTVETGQYVQVGYLMATLLRDEPMLLRFSVEPSDAPRLKAGMVVSFTMRETQRQYQAKITLVSGAAEAATHTVGVTAEVNSEGHKYWLRPGSFCDVSINVGATRDAPLIPRTAARATDHGYIVYVVKDDVASERAVTLGMSTKDGQGLAPVNCSSCGVPKLLAMAPTSKSARCLINSIPSPELQRVRNPHLKRRPVTGTTRGQKTRTTPTMRRCGREHHSSLHPQSGLRVDAHGRDHSIWIGRTLADWNQSVS
jgi:membrane fusion protein, multidrug efflux system